MASSNHINYWNYLETVTADRNKEALQRQGYDIQSELNKTVQNVNVAQASKLVSDKKLSEGLALKAQADTETALAMAKSIVANIDFTGRMTTNKEEELKFQIRKFGKEFGISEKEIKVKQDLLQNAIDKLAQDKEIATADREKEYLKIFAGLMGSIVGAAAKLGGKGD